MGGSIAHGWRDASGGGYLERAFSQFFPAKGQAYTIENKAIPGAKIDQVTSMYSGWLQQYQPNIVVLSWGTLNDLAADTPLPDFVDTFREEIDQALATRAMVMVITPPVSRASYTTYRALQARFINAELEVVGEMHNPNVVSFDLFGQMKTYLATHHRSVREYSADGWHPNTAGHALAGDLLAGELKRYYRYNTPLYE